MTLNTIHEKLVAINNMFDPEKGGEGCSDNELPKILRRLKGYNRRLLELNIEGESTLEDEALCYTLIECVKEFMEVNK